MLEIVCMFLLQGVTCCCKFTVDLCDETRVFLMLLVSFGEDASTPLVIVILCNFCIAFDMFWGSAWCLQGNVLGTNGEQLAD